jgi:hypothetical protein
MTPKDPGKLTDHISLGTLTRIVPRYIVDEVLAETNRREQRSRTLPAHLVVYFVLALSLFTTSTPAERRTRTHAGRVGGGEG